MSPNLRLSFSSIFLSLVIAGCGGGGGGSSTPDTGTTPAGTSGGTTGGTTGGTSGGSTTGGTTGGATGGTSGGSTTGGGTTGGTTTGSGSTQLTMTCTGGYTQCSGGTAITTENGITLTSSGVQAYGTSTSDLTANSDPTKATGFTPATGGFAEVRIIKDAATGAVSSPAVLLNKLGITWDGKTERPQIVETFATTLSRTILNTDGSIKSVVLPDSSDTKFYDFATLGVGGTQANYANNSYFPRPATNPPRCPGGGTACGNQETTPLVFTAGDWKTDPNGTIPDVATVSRLHSDGDVHAGDLTGTTDHGVPFPGSKGYRTLVNYSYQYANIGAWISSDTALIEEWANKQNEHTQNRRGIVSFGQVTDSATIPTTGTASYVGTVRGWYSASQAGDPDVFQAEATVTVDFATRKVSIAVANAVVYTANGAPVPVNFTASTLMGAAGSNTANYLTGTATAGTLTGGISGRYYGPVATGGSGAGPAEIGGAFTLKSANGSTAVAGFVARKK